MALRPWLGRRHASSPVLQPVSRAGRPGRRYCEPAAEDTGARRRASDDQQPRVPSLSIIAAGELVSPKERPEGEYHSSKHDQRNLLEAWAFRRAGLGLGYWSVQVWVWARAG